MNQLWLDLAKKIRYLVGIPSQLDGIRTSIDHQTRAICDATKAASENKQQQWPASLAVVVELKTDKTEQTEKRTQYKQNRTLQILLTAGTWLAFLAAAIYAGIAACQLQQMKKTTEAETRPWLAITVDPLALEAADDRVKFTIHLRNYGQSPAREIVNNPTFYLISQDIARIGWFRVYGVCEDADRFLIASVEQRGLITTVFQGEHGTVTTNVIATISLKVPQEPPPPIGYYHLLIGCVAYRGPLGGIYHTRVIYGIQVQGLERPPEPHVHTAIIEPNPRFYDAE